MGCLEFSMFFSNIYTYIPIQGSLWNNLGYIVSARGHTNHGDKHVSASRIGTDTATSLAIESFESKKRATWYSPVRHGQEKLVSVSTPGKNHGNVRHFSRTINFFPCVGFRMRGTPRNLFKWISYLGHEFPILGVSWLRLEAVTGETWLRTWWSHPSCSWSWSLPASTVQLCQKDHQGASCSKEQPRETIELGLSFFSL